MVELLLELLKIPSPTGMEGACLRFLEARLNELGMPVRRQQVSEGRYNLLAGALRPTALLCTHVDTVEPWFEPDFDGRIVRGRGACDAKGPLAAMMDVLSEFSREGSDRIGMLILVGEEVDSDGARRAAQTEIVARAVILGEPTGNRLAAAQKGSLVFRISTKGQAGHSSGGDLSRSAIHRLLAALARLERSDWGGSSEFGSNHFHVGRIQGGTGPNVYAGSAFAEGMVRIATSVDEIRLKISELLGDGVQLDVLSASDPMRLHTLAGFERTVAPFGSDAPYLQRLGKVYLAGPGSIDFAHAPNERISLAELQAGRELYRRMVDMILSDEIDLKASRT
ncbi:MAG TPA: M20/M25/M40 family metallo-hydrolase [Acidobacteriota bacterium]|nr:M20/M25/M40 family metallo-hydrolase [Acidobacteriota bacterium]